MKKILLLWLLMLPLNSFAESTIDCHCFQNRTFNSQLPAATDPYFLATAQNGFMALVYGLDKKALVKAKMAGADSTELWIIYELAELSGRSAEDVTQYYQQTGSWRSVVLQLKLDPESLGVDAWVALESPAQLEILIADRRLVKHLQVSSVAVAGGRAAGMNTQQLLLAILSGSEPEQLSYIGKSEQRSWGELLFEKGIGDGNSLSLRLKEYF